MRKTNSIGQVGPANKMNCLSRVHQMFLHETVAKGFHLTGQLSIFLPSVRTCSVCSIDMSHQHLPLLLWCQMPAQYRAQSLI